MDACGNVVFFKVRRKGLCKSCWAGGGTARSARELRLRVRIYDSSPEKITGDKVYRGARSYKAVRRHSVGGIASRARVCSAVHRGYSLVYSWYSRPSA